MPACGKPSSTQWQNCGTAWNRESNIHIDTHPYQRHYLGKWCNGHVARALGSRAQLPKILIYAGLLEIVISEGGVINELFSPLLVSLTHLYWYKNIGPFSEKKNTLEMVLLANHIHYKFLCANFSFLSTSSKISKYYIFY